MDKNSNFSSCVNSLMGILFLLILTVTSCTDDREPNGSAGSNDYYPLVQNSKKIYLKRYLHNDNTPFEWSDTIIYTVRKDTIVYGIKYSPIYDQFEQPLLVRKDKTKYYGRNIDFYSGFTQEYLFLDENLSTGSTWTHIKNEGLQKTDYSIKSRSKETIINNILYKDVIEVTIDHFILEDGAYKKTSSGLKIYARNIGEVYSYKYNAIEGVFMPKYEMILIEYSNH